MENLATYKSSTTVLVPQRTGMMNAHYLFSLRNFNCLPGRLEFSYEVHSLLEDGTKNMVSFESDSMDIPSTEFSIDQGLPLNEVLNSIAKVVFLSYLEDTSAFGFTGFVEEVAETEEETP